MADVGPPLLSLRGVVLEFGGQRVLNGIDLTVEAGEVVALIGPNGAGKSALLNCISGVYRPGPASDVRLAGLRIDGLPADRISRLGLRRTFQGLHLVPELTVLDNVLLGLADRYTLGAFGSLLAPWITIRDERRNVSRARDMIEACGLDEIRAERAGDLPLGALRRVDLARALVDEPRLLLLDEPASGLSHEERPLIGEMVRLARAVRNPGVLWIEHDLELVLSEAHRAVVLHHGDRIDDGDPRRPADRRRLIAAYKDGRPATGSDLARAVDSAVRGQSFCT